MTDNATTSPNVSGGYIGIGPNKLGDMATPLVNEVNPSNDTSMVDVPEGTVTIDGRWGV